MAALCDKLKEKEALRDAPSPEDLTSDQRLFAQLNLSRDTYYSLHEGTAFSHWMEVVKVKAVMRKRRVEKAAEKVLPRGT